MIQADCIDELLAASGATDVRDVMSAFGMRYDEALEHLSAHTGIKLRHADRRQPHPHRRLYEVLAQAAEFYRYTLWYTEAGAPGREYLAGRGFDAAATQAFGIGYSPDLANGFSGRAQRRGFDLAELAAAGLTFASGDDFFRARIMLPVHDVVGRVIGFGGRKLTEDGFGQKYINSPNTPLYVKGCAFYRGPGAEQFVQQAGEAVVVEGYLDALALWQHGFYNVLALAGTAFSLRQLAELRRLTPRAYVALDADDAGELATETTLAKARESGLHLIEVHLPEGEDPADVVLSEGGPTKWLGHLSQSLMV